MPNISVSMKKISIYTSPCFQFETVYELGMNLFSEDKQ